MNIITKHRYELIAFFTSAAVLTLEIVGARLIAPYFGTSTYVWTAMIGVILGSLAIGYSLGGKMADRDQATRTLQRIIVVAALFIMFMGVVQGSVLEWLSGLELGLRLGTLLSAILLFSVPSVFIGMVSPHLAKIRITSLESSGKSVGRLEAAGALGSIAGTFLCGYVLLGLFGSRSIILGVAVVLLVTALLASHGRRLKQVSAIIAVVVLLLPIANRPQSANAIADIDTSYARYQVVNLQYGSEPITGLLTDNRGIQSGVSRINKEKLIFSYIQQFDAALKNNPQAKSILVIGGGTFTFPVAAARNNPDLQVDAVEIDPRLTDLSKQYFDLPSLDNLHIINQDGRTYLNEATKKYDMVFLDAYNATSPPFQLTTQQALEAAKNRLNPKGVLVSNIIGKNDAPHDEYLLAMQSTTTMVFNQSALYPAVLGYDDPLVRINYILFAANDADELQRTSAGIATAKVPPQSNGLVLTDDYAPIEQLVD